MANNQEKLDQVHNQTNDRGAWFFTHIADTILDRQFTIQEADKPDRKTSLRTEVSYLFANFRLVRNMIAENTAVQKTLVAALNSVSKGEPFDEAKLLAGVQAAARAGVGDALASVESTVTIKKAAA
jgi:predicted phage-related endonuclease